MAIKMGKETKETYVKFEVEMDRKDWDTLRNYAMEHILSDEAELVNYAFNRILREQVEKEKAWGQGAQGQDAQVQMRLWRNLKNGRLYEVYGTVTNSTNAQDGQTMVLYRSDGDDKRHVREIHEFIQKFEPVEGEPGQGTQATGPKPKAT